jgi:biopolymer transport protein ExbD
MQSSFGRGKGISSMSEINVTPLLDLAFVLLVIFMISTPMMNQKEAPIKVTLPVSDGKGGAPDEKEQFQTLSVDRTGRLFFGSEAVSEAEMDRRLATLAASAKPPVLTIRGDRDGKYQSVITLLSLVKKNKLSRISLDTETR